MRSLDNQILKLLSNNDVTFFIPPYQRNYEWEEELCENFYKDIEKVADSENAQHFLGTVIYHSEEMILGQPDKYILVDGRQRLTTTMLFLIAARVFGDAVGFSQAPLRLIPEIINAVNVVTYRQQNLRCG